MDHFTLHVRLTKRCNASCSYCSSWQDTTSPHMTVAQFRTAIDFIADRVLPVFGYGAGASTPGGAHAAVQYLGGELLTVPRQVLKGCVLYARERLGQVFETVIDGAQSNLIGSDSRVAFLSTLFGSRISTSVDSFGTRRTVNGSAAQYRAIMGARRRQLRERRGLNPGAIFVVDSEGARNAVPQVAEAAAEGYDITVRPVFQGGSSIDPAGIDEMRAVFVDLYDRWIFRQPIVVQPFHRLLSARLGTRSGHRAAAARVAGCPFQRDCARVSLDLEPNGDLYVCQDMADGDQYGFGNALNGSLDLELWGQLLARREHLDSHCRVCTWRAECQGGCMSEAIHHTGSLYGRTDLCPVWKDLFARMDETIDRHGWQAVDGWLRALEDASARPAPRARAMAEDAAAGAA